MSLQKQHITLRIRGIDCASCAQTLETGVSQLTGVQSCTLNLSTEKLSLTGQVTQEAIIERVRLLGYDVEDRVYCSQTTESPSFLRFLWQRNNTRLVLLGAVLILPGLVLQEILHIQHPLLTLCSVGALIAAGMDISHNALRALFINRQITINLLMTIAAIGAVIIGASTEAGMVMVLFAIGEALEGYTANRARDSLRSLMSVVPEEATLIQSQNDFPVRVSVEDLKVGDIIMVKPGERIPMDGRVTSGTSSINQAPITGESRLIEKERGSEVFASSINGEGTLEIEVTRLASDNTISRLIQMVEEAQEKRAPVQRIVDRFAHSYTPAVVLLAILIALVPPIFFGQPFWNPNEESFGWFYRALALLVVACPCALVISTPVSIISAMSNGARNGVLIKGGAYLEILSRVKVIAFDKTGTLTQGKPSVMSTRSVACHRTYGENPSEHGTDLCDNCNDLLALASVVEQRSEHPLATAIVRESVRRGVHQKYPAAEMVTALTGQGVKGYVQGQLITIGSHRFFDSTIPHTDDHCSEAAQDAKQGYTTIMVSANDTYLGKITVSDMLRPESQAVVAMLKEMGITSLVMLTGDNTESARKVAQAIGISDVRAELLPGEKVAIIQHLQETQGTVAMIGDGINDTPALATADVGIAMGVASGGSVQAMETADLSLMSDDLRQLPFTLRLSRATMQTIRINIILSVGIKLGFIILTLFGLGTMWMVVLADMGTSLLVTLNGMRLLRTEKGTDIS